MQKELRVIQLLLPLLKWYPWAAPAIVALGIASSMAEGLGISLFIPLLQSFDPSNSAQASTGGLLGFLNQAFAGFTPQQRLFLISLCILGSITLKSVLAYSNLAIFSWFNSHISHRLRCGIFNQLLTVSYQGYFILIERLIG